MNMFETPPAGTPVEPTNAVRYYYRQQIYPATPSTGPNFTPGREVQFRFQASSHAFVPQESRLMARVRVDKSNDNGASWTQAVEPSIRYAADPLSRRMPYDTTIDSRSTLRHHRRAPTSPPGAKFSSDFRPVRTPLSPRRVA